MVETSSKFLIHSRSSFSSILCSMRFFFELWHFNHTRVAKMDCTNAKRAKTVHKRAKMFSIANTFPWIQFILWHCIGFTSTNAEEYLINKLTFYFFICACFFRVPFFEFFFSSICSSSLHHSIVFYGNSYTFDMQQQSAKESSTFKFTAIWFFFSV